MNAGYVVPDEWMGMAMSADYAAWHAGAGGWGMSARDDAIERALMAAWVNDDDKDAPVFRAALAEQGYAVVPVEPTAAMLEAGNAAQWRKMQDVASPTPTEHPRDGGGSLGYAYRAMLAAAGETQA
jgi:hypothetical protein